MIRIDATKQEWELLLSIVEKSSSAYLAKSIVNEIKNQIIKDEMKILS